MIATLPSQKPLDFAAAICRLASELNDLMEFPKAEIEALWCPWRVEYFEQETPNPHFLSEAAQASDDAAHLVITRRKNGFLMMNRYPYSVGHLMAVPYRKTADASSLGENEVLELWNLAMHGQRLLRETVKAQGFNIGLNLGNAPARACPIICISTSCPAGMATRISCPSFPAPASSRKACAGSTIN